MATVHEKLQDLQNRNERVVLGGGQERIEAQHRANKMTAHERLHLLFDRGFYDELFRFVQHSSTAFGLGEKELPADGVVTGLGANQRPPGLRLFPRLHRHGGERGVNARPEDL